MKYMPVRRLGSQCFIKVSCPPLSQTLKGYGEARLTPLKWDGGEGMFSATDKSDGWR